MGSDLSIVNAARVSYDRESIDFKDKDKKLLEFLVREGHTSPFRHAALTFEVYAPLFVARQWWKYAVSSTHVDDQNGWNESSRRYITESELFYIPNEMEWRSAPENSKQGSGDPVSVDIGHEFTKELVNTVLRGSELYNRAMQYGIAPEQARLFLPAYGLFVRWRWTVSLQGAITFLEQRLGHDAQVEIQLYAQEVAKIIEEEFPETYKALGL
jgi:thymidylate synthase (FAD)